MTRPATSSTYGELLGDRRLRWMFTAAFLGRLPYGVETLAAVLFFSAQTGSYARAGVAAGAISAGIAIGVVTHSRRADRHGPGALLPLGVVHALFVVLLILAGLSDWSTTLVVGLAFGTGVAVPPTSSLVRSLYPAALGGRQRLANPTFAVDAAITEITYVIGPALVSLIVLTVNAAAALALGAASALMSMGILLAVVAHQSPSRAAARLARGALGAPGVAVLVLASVPLGISFGILEVALPAFATAAGERSAGALMFVAMAVGGAIGSMTAGARADRMQHARVVVAGSFAYPLVALLPIAGSTPTEVALLAVPFGLINGPWILGRNVLTGELALPGTTTEAFAWLITALLLGASLGNVLGGVLVEQASWRVAAAFGALVTTVTIVVTVSSRSSLKPQSAAAARGKP
jgi:Major Facilitator Superfamily